MIDTYDGSLRIRDDYEEFRHVVNMGCPNREVAEKIKYGSATWKTWESEEGTTKYLGRTLFATV